MERCVFATFDYEASSDVELSFRKGQSIVVKNEHVSGWWCGLLEGKGEKLLFPSSFTSAGGGVPGVVPPRGTFYQSIKFAGMPATPAPKKVVRGDRIDRRPVMAAPLPPPAPAASTEEDENVGDATPAPDTNVGVLTLEAAKSLLSGGPADAVGVAANQVVTKDAPPPPVSVAPPPGRSASVSISEVHKGSAEDFAGGTIGRSSGRRAGSTGSPVVRKKSTLGLASGRREKRASVNFSAEGGAPVTTGSSPTGATGASGSVAASKGSAISTNEPGSPSSSKVAPAGTTLRSIRGLFMGSSLERVQAQEAPAMLESSPRTKMRKEREGWQEMATTHSQSLAAERFKAQVARIYETEDLSNIRQVFDGLAGSDAADEYESSMTQKPVVEEEGDPTDLPEERIASRAALNLFTSSPKVYQQMPDSPSEKLRALRELEAAERFRGRRSLLGDLDEASSIPGSPVNQNRALRKGKARMTSSSPGVVSMNPKSVPERSSAASAAGPGALGAAATRKRSGSVIMPSTTAAADPTPGLPAPASMKRAHESLPDQEVSLEEMLQKGRVDEAFPETEESRRVQYFGQCILSEWAESHSMRDRAWAPGSSKRPELKNKTWALVDVKDGEFNVEVGKEPPCPTVADFEVGRYWLEDVDCYRFWLKDFFVIARHQYFLCEPEESAEKKKGFAKRKDKDEAALAPAKPVLIIVRLGDDDRGDPSYVMAYHAHGTARVQCSYASTKQLEWFLRKSPYVTNLGLQGVRPYLNKPLDRHMLSWERSTVQRGFKFGVLYASNGQTKEEDIYSNEKGSDEFRIFLTRLGNIIPLKGHAGYRAGLNVTANLTGFLGVYNSVTFNEDGELLYDLTSHPNDEDPDPSTLKFRLEVMFHVSTFLPFMPENPQQLNRKRHIGNDVCVVIFKERSNTGFDEAGKPKEANEALPPRVFTSQFNHVFIVVTPWKFDDRLRTTHYKVAVCSKDGVKPCRPYLPKNGIISVKKFTPWILAKLINCERAAMYAKSFSLKEARTNTALMGEALQIMANRRGGRSKD